MWAQTKLRDTKYSFPHITDAWWKTTGRPKKKLIIFWVNLAYPGMTEQFGLCIGIIGLAVGSWHIAWSKACDVVYGHHSLSFKNTEVSIIVTEQIFFLFFFLTWIQFEGEWNIFIHWKKSEQEFPWQYVWYTSKSMEK